MVERRLCAATSRRWRFHLAPRATGSTPVRPIKPLAVDQAKVKGPPAPCGKAGDEITLAHDAVHLGHPAAVEAGDVAGRAVELLQHCKGVGAENAGGEPTTGIAAVAGKTLFDRDKEHADATVVTTVATIVEIPQIRFVVTVQGYQVAPPVAGSLVGEDVTVYLQNRAHQGEKIFMSDSEILADRMLRPGLARLSKAAAIAAVQFIGREAQ